MTCASFGLTYHLGGLHLALYQENHVRVRVYFLLQGCDKGRGVRKGGKSWVKEAPLSPCPATLTIHDWKLKRLLGNIHRGSTPFIHFDKGQRINVTQQLWGLRGGKGKDIKRETKQRHRLSTPTLLPQLSHSPRSLTPSAREADQNSFQTPAGPRCRRESLCLQSGEGGLLLCLYSPILPPSEAQCFRLTNAH